MNLIRQYNQHKNQAPVLTRFEMEKKVTCPVCSGPFWRTWRELKYGLTCPACDNRIIWDARGLHAEQCYARTKKQGRYSVEFVRSYYNELKQHGVPFKTAMQWLSRVYGGRGGYTSEELYKIATGKDISSYYIFPFVKNAPPEVNRILEQAYRTHRKKGDSKTASAIAAWNRVRKAGYVQEKRLVPVWIKKR